MAFELLKSRIAPDRGAPVSAPRPGGARPANLAPDINPANRRIGG